MTFWLLIIAGFSLGIGRCRGQLTVSAAKPADPSRSLSSLTSDAHVPNTHESHIGEIHVDMPGQHGNDRLHPIVHRTGRHERGTHVGGETHIDAPGQHGNTRNHPVVHRDFNTRAHGPGSVLSSAQQRISPVTQEFHHGQHTGGETHVDLPGQHGNLSPVPVIHHDHGPGTEAHFSSQGQRSDLLPITTVPHRPSEGTQTSPLAQQISLLHTVPQHGVFSPVSGVQTQFPFGQQQTFLPPTMMNGGSLDNGMPGMMPFPMQPQGMAPFSSAPFGTGPFSFGAFPADPAMRRRRFLRFRVLQRLNRLERTNTLLTGILAELVRRMPSRA